MVCSGRWRSEGASGTEKGTPKTNVWTERAKFDEAANKMQEEMVKLVVVAKANNLDTLKAAFGKTAEACKGCHDHFRNQQAAPSRTLKAKPA